MPMRAEAIPTLPRLKTEGEMLIDALRLSQDSALVAMDKP